MSKSSNYWKDRAISLEALMQTNTNQTMIAINKIYSEASKSLTKSINKIFTRYVTGGKINPEYAKQLLNEKQTKEYRNKLKALLAETEDENLRRDIINTLDAPAYGARISRLEALRDNLYYQARAIGAKEVELVEDRLVNVIEQSYYRTIYADQVNSGIYDFEIISDRKIQAMLAHEWEGGNYSSRLWNNNKEFADKIAETLEVGCLAGWTLDEMCSELKEHVIGDTSDKGQRFITSRLVRTEVNYFSNQGILEGLKAAGFTKYRFIATLDLRTSTICRSLDLKEFDIAEAEIGVNLPPMHPFCRSVIVPAYEGENRAGRTRWARDPKTGRGMYVPADMSYDDWYKKFVLGNNGKGHSAGNDTKSNKNNMPKCIGTIDFNDKNAIIKTLKEFEKKAVDLPYESNCTITSDGKVWLIDGSSGFVASELIQTQEGGSNLKGSYSYHNHPKAETHFSFSNLDVGFFLEYGEAYSKASDYKYSYIMRRTKETLKANYDDIVSEFKEIETSDVFQMSIDGVIDIDEDGYHEVLKILSKRYHFDYERTKK